MFRPLVDDLVSSTDYFVFLLRTYGFEAPLESALAMLSGLDNLIDLRERQKAGLVAADLLALGLRPSEVTEVPQCLDIPQLRTVAEGLGWLYVVERSTLAHSVIRGHLIGRLPHEMQCAAGYLQAYAEVVGVRWRQLSRVLDDVAARGEGAADRMIEAADHGFRIRRRWMADRQITRLAAV